MINAMAIILLVDLKKSCISIVIVFQVKMSELVLMEKDVLYF